MSRAARPCFACVLLLALAAPAHSAAAPTAGESRLGPSMAGAAELIATGRAGEARTLLRLALEAARRRADARDEAGCYLLLGFADVAVEDAAAARTDLAQGAAKLQARGDGFGAWMGLWMLAEVEKQEGQFTASIARHEEALAQVARMNASDEPLSFETFKDLGVFLGLPDELLSLLGPQLALAKPILLRFAELVSRDSYGSVLVEAGQLARAETELVLAGDLSHLFGGLLDASVAAHVGDLRRRQFRLDEARESYRQALGSAKSVPSVPFQHGWIEYQILDKLADLELLSGRPEEALAWNERALALARSQDPRREASILDARANLLLRIDRFDAASKVFGEALALARKGADASRQGEIWMELGILSMLSGKYGTAATDLERAIELLQGANRPDAEAQAWALLAEVHLILDARSNVDEPLERARALAAKSGFRPAQVLVEMLTSAHRFLSGSGSADELEKILQRWSEMSESGGTLDEATYRILQGLLSLDATSAGAPPPSGLADVAAEPGVPVLPALACMLQGRLLFQRGDFAAARERWLAGLAKNPSKDLRSGFLAAIGAAWWRQGKSEEALRYLGQAADALEVPLDDLKVEEMLAGYLGSERRLYFEVFIELLARQGRVEEAFDYTERARARAFLQLLGNRRLRPAHGADERLAREAEALRTQITEWERALPLAAAEERGGIRADLEHARQRYQSLMEQVKISNSEYASLTRVEPHQLQAVQGDLPPGTTLISYFVTASRVHAWVLDRATASYVSLPIAAAELERIGCWTDQIAHRVGARGLRVLGSPCSGEPANAEQVYEQLIAPLRDRIRNRRLVLVPYGVLHYVPFAALRDPKSGRYLVEDYTLTYAPSATALHFLRGKESPLKGRALVLGDPATASPDLGPLPAAATEAAAVARALGTTPMLGTRAAKSLLYHLDGKVDLVHIAAHGVYDSANPLFSYVALAPGEERDGNLTVHEILAELDLSGVDLVVLSACRTAAGQRSGGDEVVGLTRSLIYAGTPAVISTLWDIDDEASALLMADFYRRLLAGTAVADALREAQLTLLHSSRFRHPRFWAAFSLTGDLQTRWTAPASGGR